MLKSRLMLKAFCSLCLILFCFMAPGISSAFETRGQDCSKCHTLSKDEARDLIKGFAPDADVIEVRISPVKALWEVDFASRGKKVLAYVDFSKKYLLSGQILSVSQRKNLTQERLEELNKVDVSKIPLEDALVMGDPKARIRIIVFDDPD